MDGKGSCDRACEIPRYLSNNSKNKVTTQVPGTFAAIKVQSGV
jgi:hypothetical protein